jgi:molybdopterin synthase catalytic subunit
MAEKEGAAILTEARERFDLIGLACIHRIGLLEIGELAVWVGSSAVHRGPAFEACQYVINQVKVRVPVWKKEYYSDGDSGWVNCAHCAAHGHQH